MARELPHRGGCVRRYAHAMLMHMARMSRRVQILLDDERWDLLERESTRSGLSVAQLIRDAVDSRFGSDRPARREAFASILNAAPMPVDDWDVMKQELLELEPDETR